MTARSVKWGLRFGESPRWSATTLLRVLGVTAVLLTVGGCAGLYQTRVPGLTDIRRADGVLEYTVHNVNKTFDTIDEGPAIADAIVRCRSWGFSGAEVLSLRSQGPSAFPTYVYRFACTE